MRTVALCLALAAVGCHGERTPPPMCEVSGAVSVGGKPAARLLLVFTPETPGTGREEECAVENGRYRATLIAARYKVSFAPVAGGTAVPRKFQESSTSGQLLDASRPGTTDFALR